MFAPITTLCPINDQKITASQETYHINNVLLEYLNWALKRMSAPEPVDQTCAVNESQIFTSSIRSDFPTADFYHHLMLPLLFSPKTSLRHSSNANQVPFFIRRWNTLRSLKVHVERDQILEEAWHEFLLDDKTFMGLQEVYVMVECFLTAIPSVQHLLGKIPTSLISNMINRHTEIMMNRLVGDADQRIDIHLNFQDFKAVFPCMFIVAGIDRERPNVDAESTLHGLEELEKSLQPFSSYSLTDNDFDISENVIIGILRKAPNQRLFQEISFLIDLVRDSFVKYNLSNQQLRKIFLNLKLRCLDAGEYLCLEGDPGNEFYVLFSGLISVRKKGVKFDSEIGEIQNGTAFGELSLMSSDGIRHAGLMAKRDCILGVLEEADFRHFMFPFVRKIQKDKQHFFEKLPYFSKAAQNVIFDLSYSSRITTIPPKTIIYHQNQLTPNVVLFIKSGTVRAVRELLPVKVPTMTEQLTSEPFRDRRLNNHKSVLARMNSELSTARLQAGNSGHVCDSLNLKINVQLPEIPSRRSSVASDLTRVQRMGSLSPRKMRALNRFTEVRLYSLSSERTDNRKKKSTKGHSSQLVMTYSSQQISQKPIFVDIATLGPYSSIGGPLTMEKKKDPMACSFISVDHVVVFEVSIYDIIRRLDDYTRHQLSINLFRCPSDEDIRKMLKLRRHWMKYKKNIRKTKRYVEFVSPRIANPYMDAALYKHQ